MIPKAKRALIIEALKSNPNGKAVARQIGGVSHATVCDMARKLGIGLGGKGWKKFPPEARAKIAAALRANPNAAAVARKIGGISPSTVSSIAKQANIPLAAENLEKAKRLSPEKRARLIDALRANPNATTVAREIGGVSARTVQKIAEKAEITLARVYRRGRPLHGRIREAASGARA
jgi:transposase-like protein